MQFVSICRLVKGLTVDDVQHGVSSMRNPRLGTILYRLRLIEGYGTGLPTILASYDHTGCEPILDPPPNSFAVALPNLNFGHRDFPDTRVRGARAAQTLTLRRMRSRIEATSARGVTMPSQTQRSRTPVMPQTTKTASAAS